MHKVSFGLLLLVTAGCLDAAPATGDSDQTIDGTGSGVTAAVQPDDVVVSTVELAGTILARMGSSNDLTMHYTGDRPAQCFGIPGNALNLTGWFEFSPRQQIGFEFQGPSESYRTYDLMDPASHFPESPLRLAVPDPARGPWLVYGGPSTVGAALTWNMTLQLTTAGPLPAQDPPYFEPEPC